LLLFFRNFVRRDFLSINYYEEELDNYYEEELDNSSLVVCKTGQLNSQVIYIIKSTVEFVMYKLVRLYGHKILEKE